MTPDAQRLREELRARAPDGEIQIVRAPGRVNLIGEHTDYNGGWVLPCAIDLEIAIAFVQTDDRRVELTRLDSGERSGFDLDAVPAARGEWIDHVAGTAWSLASSGVELLGLRGVIAATLPISAGLSSSAALEIAAAWALCAPPPPPLELARIAQRVENEYLGLRSGLMDQLAVTLARRDSALLIDCRSLDWRAVLLPLERHAIVVCDSGLPRRLEDSRYNDRRAECEAVAAALELESLREATKEMLSGLRGGFDPVALRRADHVLAENERVLDCAAALERGDLAAVGRLFAASQASLRDLFEVSSPELDALVEIASGCPGVVGARMTGAGFGGCTVNLVERGALSAFAATILSEYEARTGLIARVFAVDPADAAGRVEDHPGAFTEPTG
jgi:galactokinase